MITETNTVEGSQEQPVYTHFDTVMIQPAVALIFGILILLFPRLLNYLVAIYLVFAGIVGLWPNLLPNLFHR